MKKGVEIILKNSIVEGKNLLVDGGRIAGLTEERIPGAEIVDAHGLFLSPGLVDMHVHGGDGADYMDGTAEAFQTAARCSLAGGATTVYPTTLCAPMDKVERIFEVFRRVKDLPGLPHMPGLHLEGPFLNPVKCGGQDPAYLAVPDLARAREILSHSDDVIRWTIAPELDHALELGKMLARRGVVCSVGHTDASYAQVEAAMFAGFSMMTHFYSAMSACYKVGCYRVAGAVEAGYLLDGLSVEMIADGKHLPKEILRMVWKFKGADRVALCSDALAPAGLPEGSVFYNGRPPHGAKSVIHDGVGKLFDHSALAGSIASADRLVRVMYKEVGVPLYDAVEMMSLSPAKMVAAHGKGSIRIGKDADFVIFDDDIQIKSVITAGKLVI